MTIKNLFFGLPMLVLGWLAVLVSVALLSDESPATLVLFPSKNFVTNLPEGTAILGSTAYSITVSSENTDFAASLYRQGAWIVLPAGLAGCSG